MRQIDEQTLGFIIRYELNNVSKATLKDMGSGHGDTRRRGISAAADRILQRMHDWEILVPESRGNIFETVGIRSGQADDAAEEKGPT